MEDRMKDAEIAVKEHGWVWHVLQFSGKRILSPPITDKRIHWATVWDKDGIPGYLPRYSEGEEQRLTVNELIAELEKVGNKEKEVYVWEGENTTHMTTDLEVIADDDDDVVLLIG